jgi:uncharacterized protein (TIGR03083 family)
MTQDAIEALRADHGALAALAGSFTAGEWAAPSACAGWSVQDLLAHMTQLFRQVVDPASLPPGDPSGLTERTQDRWVEALRGTPADELLDEYRQLGAQALDALAGIQGVDDPMDLGDLGTHPLHLVANAFAFDHVVHIRVDLLAPGGPLDRPAPPLEECHRAAAADWMVAGIPQMTPAAVARPVELVVSGPGGRRAHLGPDGPPVATVTSSIDDLVRWGTGRAAWRELPVEVEGDLAAGAAFCDAVHVF